MINFKWTLIAGAVVGIIAFGAGWQTRDAFCDAAEQKAKVVQLTQAINDQNRMIEARERELRSAEVAQAEQARLIEQQRADMAQAAVEHAKLVEEIEDGPCFSDQESDDIRDTFGRR